MNSAARLECYDESRPSTAPRHRQTSPNMGKVCTRFEAIPRLRRAGSPAVARGERCQECSSAALIDPVECTCVRGAHSPVVAVDNHLMTHRTPRERFIPRACRRGSKAKPFELVPPRDGRGGLRAIPGVRPADLQRDQGSPAGTLEARLRSVNR